ncbi:MAG TPA: hypothetical protein C5S37_04225 [Methanophagales archaeon]|nr:hypothetical protein [Methanophagales archaeon]
MKILREKILVIEGKGVLTPKIEDQRHIEIPVKFTCAQYRDGVIDGTITLTEEDHSPYLNFFPPFKEVTFSLKAYLDEGNLNIESLNISRVTPAGTELRDIFFVTTHLKIKRKEISSASNQIWCKFDVSNLKSLKTIFDIEEGKVTFANYETSKEIWKEIETYKKSGITGAIIIKLSDAVRQQSIEVSKSLLFKKIDKILRLASLSQGNYIDWASFELCEQFDEEKIEGFYSERKSIRPAFSAGHELTSYLDLSNYFKKTYFNYTDNLDTKMGFKFSVEWYLESLNRGLLESKYLRLYIVLETFIYRFATIQKKECRKALSTDIPTPNSPIITQ